MRRKIFVRPRGRGKYAETSKICVHLAKLNSTHQTNNLSEIYERKGHGRSCLSSIVRFDEFFQESILQTIPEPSAGETPSSGCAGNSNEDCLDYLNIRFHVGLIPYNHSILFSSSLEMTHAHHAPNSSHVF